MLENTENKNNIKAIERFFCNNKKGAFLFVVGNDELVRNDVLKKSNLLLFGSKKYIEIFSFNKDYNPEFTLLQNLSSFLKEKQVDGLVFIDLEYIIIDDDKSDLMTQINFSREALLELRLPILFWIKNETVSKFSYYAADIYNQRVSSNIYFDYSFSNETEMVTDGYLMEKTASNNPSIEKHKLRIKLLNEQLEQAKYNKVTKKNIANDIVVELLIIYVEIPNSEKPIINLLQEYNDFFNLSEADKCFTLARANQSINHFSESELYYSKALATYRKLAQTNPETYLPYVATTLNNLGTLQSDKNDYSTTELSYNEALEIRRKLAQSNPVTYLPAVAGTLNNLGNLQSNKNDFATAELSYNEALEIRRKLAQSNPETYLPAVAMTLNNLGNLHSNKNDYATAELSYKEALGIRRKLAQSNPETYLPAVAMTLNNLGNLQSNKNDYATAQLSYNEALEIRRKLAQTNPETYLPDVATTLNNLGVLQQNKNDYATAELSYNEALEIRRKLAQANPETYLPDVAMTILNISFFYQEGLIDKEKSLALCKEAITILIPFSLIGYIQKYLIFSFNILKEWEINPKIYLKENFPNNPELLDLLDEE